MAGGNIKKNNSVHIRMYYVVDGGWSEWQRWSPCSAKCDKGIRYRKRSCSQPEPEEPGNNCTGEFLQTSFCYVVPCKGKNCVTHILHVLVITDKY